MTGDCPNCPTLQAANARLMGGIAATLATINAELEEEQTMNRHQLVLHIKDRLSDVLTSAY